jgi:exodeoxyribonuclease VII large subunit
MSRGYVFTVRQLTRYLRSLLTQDDTLQAVAVRGEISNFVRHSSGHLYFTLKDEFSQLRCVLFREDAEALPFPPEDGMQVTARGAITIYEPRGQYQLVVRELERPGVGELYLAFERLRKKLEAEGLFDPARKRALPPFPRKIALLTSPVGAAFHDLMTTLRDRWPVADLVLIPTPVSGAAAAPGIVRALGQLAAMEGLDLALLARGGGSLEELAGFNAEPVARAIAAAPVPVVTGVGHETDLTIADLVADRRAATPTAAAVAATPDRRTLLAQVERFRRGLADRLQRMVAQHRRELALLRARPVLGRPRLMLATRRQLVDELLAAARAGLARRLRATGDRAARAQEKLAALSPRAVLRRGYSITRLPDGSVVRSARALAAGAAAEVIFSEGSADVTVQRTRLPSEEERP